MKKNKITLSIFVAVCIIGTIVGYSLIKQNDSNKYDQLAVMTQQDDGTYIRSNMSVFGDDNYEFDHAVCNNGSTVTANSNGGLNLKVIGTDKCTVYLKKAKSLIEKIKSNAQTGNPNFLSGTETGIYTMQDDYGTSYYFRGNITNNYVQFGNYYWRIVRLNGDGSLRLMYDGTTAHANGENSTDRALAASSAFNEPINASYYDAPFIGYMESSSKTSTSSTIKINIDSWYETNIRDKGFDKYLSDILFCNDKSEGSGGSEPVEVVANYSDIYNDRSVSRLITSESVRPVPMAADPSNIYYGVNIRISQNKDPILTCPQKSDAFTVSDTTKGNGALTYPIALLTADEYMLAGGKAFSSAPNLYLNKPGIDWWLGSPYFESGWSRRMGLIVTNNNSMTNTKIINEKSVVPVINIHKAYVETMTGSGTMTNPYVVTGVLPEGYHQIRFEITSSEWYIDTETKIVKEGEPYGVFPNPNFDSMYGVPADTFQGWYTEPDGKGEKITSSTIVSSSAHNQTLYAYFMDYIVFPGSDVIV